MHERTVLHFLNPVDEFVDHVDHVGGCCYARNVKLSGGGGEGWMCMASEELLLTET